MSVPRLSPREVLPLVRRLACVPDPLALFTALTEGGRRPDTLLLESADAHDAAGQRSLIVARSMLRLAGREGAIEADALTANGEALRGALGLDQGARRLARNVQAPVHAPAQERHQDSGDRPAHAGECNALAMRASSGGASHGPPPRRPRRDHSPVRPPAGAGVASRRRTRRHGTGSPGRHAGPSRR